MGNQRGYAWLDESVEHTQQEEARAQALATKWSQLHNDAEERMFARMSDFEDGRCDYNPYEDCECAVCLGLNGDGVDPETGAELEVGGPNCLVRKEDEQAAADKEAERQLEVEMVEEKLARIGARMMRPYEHWNEDEQYVEYMERER